MKGFSQKLQIRWSDIDANFHLRHSVYYDFGAQMRTVLLSELGLTMAAMQAAHFGPVLFREEAIFKREIRMGDDIEIDVKLSKLKKDYSRFSFVHHIRKADGTLCAIMNVDGAWIDTQIRKVIAPPHIGQAMLDAMPKTEDFEWLA